MLEGSGFQVISASDGYAALQLLRSTHKLPSVIVSDVMMPTIDGYELLHSVRQEKEWLEIPFIFLTAQTEEQQIRQGMVAGVDDYLIKPFSPEHLIAAIDSKLRRRAQLAQTRAMQIGKVKHDILNILNHEMRTPLTPVVAYADMLNADIDAMSRDELKQFVQGIQLGAARLRQLVEDFILLVELQTGSAAEQHERHKSLIHDYEELLRSVTDLIHDKAAAKEVAVYVEIQDPVSPMVGSPIYVQNAIMRLVDNAVKFSETPGSHVLIVVHSDAANVCFDVIDHGRGIPQEELGQIFDMFYQINRQHFEDQGTGSGLAIVRGIMAMHDGEVLVQSTLGQGSTFTLCFPAAT
jgi:signal transduction histidine kinase